MVACFIVVFIYWVVPDRDWTRELLPWAFLTSAIACVLIFAWICIYIECIFGGNVVKYLPRFVFDKGNDPLEGGTKRNDDEVEYARMTKSNYIATHIGALLMAVLYLGFFFICKDWVDTHNR